LSGAMKKGQKGGGYWLVGGGEDKTDKPRREKLYFQTSWDDKYELEKGDRLMIKITRKVGWNNA